MAWTRFSQLLFPKVIFPKMGFIRSQSFNVSSLFASQQIAVYRTSPLSLLFRIYYNRSFRTLELLEYEDLGFWQIIRIFGPVLSGNGQ